MNEDEEKLIIRSKQGEADAFDFLARKYQAHLYNLALRMTGSASAAEDIVQEALTSAYRHLNRFEGGNFRAWLLRIAANASLDHVRSARVRKQVSLEELGENPGFALEAKAESPEEYSLRRELLRVLQRGLLTLKAERRLVLVLVDVQGLSYEEAVTVLKVPQGTVKSRLSRARADMKEYLLAHQELLPAPFRLKE
ncbi:MAG: sigma-70 family RNA polymerase sigma factor [Chloroflexi bacterium]|nr:sigma-70 family RNA polymerase sigma factor [Chloroflexota bacterium]